ncbi:MAG: pyrroloquinoline quinone biosynthesis protein PqqB [Alsobacter sp.]
MRILVLGSAAGGGFPQWNCGCPNCRLAWAGDPRVTPRSQSSLAASVDGRSWLLLNASPDIRQQIAQFPELQPQAQGRHSPIASVLLTNGDVDHVAGLLSLREGQAFTVHATAPILEALAANPIFGVLDRSVVRFAELAAGEALEPLPGLRVTPFAVPGKVPLYREGETVEIGIESGETIGLEIAGAGRRVLYVPGCAQVTRRLADRIVGADVLFFDGTCYQDDEMVRLGLSQKTSTRMGHLAMAGPDGSVARLAELPVDRRVFVHINNTNPVLVAGSPERRAVEDAGWEIGWDGLRITLEERP